MKLEDIYQYQNFIKLEDIYQYQNCIKLEDIYQYQNCIKLEDIYQYQNCMKSEIWRHICHYYRQATLLIGQLLTALYCTRQLHPSFSQVFRFVRWFFLDVVGNVTELVPESINAVFWNDNKEDPVLFHKIPSLRYAQNRHIVINFVIKFTIVTWFDLLSFLSASRYDKLVVVSLRTVLTRSSWLTYR